MREAGRDPVPGDELEIGARLRWLLRLRWLIVPVFVAVGLASDLLMLRRAPWTSLAVGAALLAANVGYAAALARGALAPALVRLARLESAFVVALPVAVVALGGDPANPLRYAVLVGVVGAAVVLPRTSDVAATGMWALAALVAGDALAVGFDPTRIEPAMVARWATEAAVIGTVAAIAGHLHAARESALARLRDARARLAGGEAQWASALDALHEMVVVTGPDGAVVRANRAFARLLGTRPQELVGRALPELLAGHPERWWSPPPNGVVEIEDPLLDTVVEVTTVRHGDHVVRVARDVGEQRTLYARLVQADKLAAIGALASGVAHDVNNPTAFVTSNLTELGRYVGAYDAALRALAAVAAEAGRRERADALLADPELAVARREAATAVAESLQGMERIGQAVANLRSVSRRDLAGDLAAPVDLADLVQAVARTAAADLRSAAARVEVDGPLWVLGRRGELVDVLLNLVVNAVHAREEGRPNRIRIALAREDGAAVLRVCDTGRGISPAQMRRLFEPSFAVNAPADGGGVGLSLARRIVLAHGGSVDVASEPGRGSTFTVRLPAMEAGSFTETALRGRSGAA
jgi:signal transduction histidine kinase